jgi:POT family proton-dependent oligopeptide transporter
MPDARDLAPAPIDHGTGFFGHPSGLAILFFTEMWERFSYYGMRAFLMIFMTATLAEGGLAFDVPKAAGIYAVYTSAVYLFGLPGGWFADRIVGQRRAVLVGGGLIAAGHFSLAIHSLSAFYTGLVLIAVGTGLLKPNISAIVGQLYSEKDMRRDAGFSIFYMGINVGALAGPLVCSFLAEKVDWHAGFGVAGVGMILGLIVYVRGRRMLGDAGSPPKPPADPVEAGLRRRRLALGLSVAGALAMIFVTLLASGVVRLTPERLADWFGAILFGITVLLFAWLFLAMKWSPLERGRLAAILVLFLAASLFWAAYEQAGSSLTLFARDLTDRVVLGVEIPVGWFQDFPAGFCIILAPVFAFVWLRMGSRQPSSPVKFSLGLIFVGLGFVVMMGASSAAAGGVKVGIGWLMLTYFLHVIGEMFLSPVGLSTVTKLAPARVTSLMMGVWFLASAVGNYIGGRGAGYYETLPLWQLFGVFALITIAAGLVLALVAQPIRRLMGGIH